MKYLVTGGAGFIGSNLVRYLASFGHQIVVLDKLTYAGNRQSIEGVENCILIKEDICNTDFVKQLLKNERPGGIFHLAAESHVDRSIDGPTDFMQTNIMGTFSMLTASLDYWQSLNDDKKNNNNFRFLHVSTDEVYGSLGKTRYFTESSLYAPNSPYSASKASSDHLVRAWHHTYGLPVVTTNCSNNYGPMQFPEKLIPHIILSAISEKPLPVYGKGENVRDWLYVKDHCEALVSVMQKGTLGQTYNIGGNCEKQNIEVVKFLCDILDELKPLPDKNSYRAQITYVKDRPGHDLRYAIDASKIKNELGWQPKETFSTGIKKTVKWYLENTSWTDNILSGRYKIERIGMADRHEYCI